MRCRRITEHMLSFFSYLSVGYMLIEIAPYLRFSFVGGGWGGGGLRLHAGYSPEGTQRLTKPSEYRRRRLVSEIAPWTKFHSISTPTL